MAYTSVAGRDLAYVPVPAKVTTVTTGLFRRVLDAMMASRQRQAEREIALYLADSDGKFTDETEREIERRFLANSSRW